MHYCIKLSGTQGDGVDTVGEILALALHAAGYWVYAYRNFSSRIRGGYSSHEIVIADSPVRAKKQHPDVLVCIGEDGWSRDAQTVSDSSLVLADTSLHLAASAQCFSLPFTDTARAASQVQHKWIVALGAVGALLGLAESELEVPVAAALAHKGEGIIAGNLRALKAGYVLAPHLVLPLPPPSQGTRLEARRLVSGVQAVAEAALACGCDFTAGYPISPATGVFEHLARHLPVGRAVQTEDEIAAVDMAIGASYAGATALVATSGPGLSLMIEGIGLAFATKTPLVIVNGQRSGPSTGMPTKHEQSDLALALAGGHGDVSAPVFCPSSVEEIYTDLPAAFHAAELYRTPVIFLTDLGLMLARASMHPVTIDATPIRNAKEGRVIPGISGKMFHVSGNQMGATGLPTEMPAQRQAQFSARLKMIPSELPSGLTYIEGGEELLVIAIGSTRGAVEAAVANFPGRVSAVFPRVLKPFPTKALAALLTRHKKYLILDANATGQLLQIFRSHFACHERFVSRFRYDGEPFMPAEVAKYIAEVLAND
ncbi:MAG: 2-oxoglutarate oxidoreductase subunit KorA [Firmicutes bacterium]|nr:2-oxoglutarate oxidoreductase subunit KorA [candidate division NPL-UPA2 bacterium]